MKNIIVRLALATSVLASGLVGTVAASFAQQSVIIDGSGTERRVNGPLQQREVRPERPRGSEPRRDDRRADRGDWHRDRDRDRGDWRRGRDRDWDRGDWRRDRDRRWDRGYRSGYYYRDRGPSVYFDVAPSYRYVEPHYVAPRYVAPRRAPAVRLSQAHVDWCHARWRSYRAYDNSYQPYNGPRRQCISPYS